MELKYELTSDDFIAYQKFARLYVGSRLKKTNPWLSFFCYSPGFFYGTAIGLLLMHSGAMEGIGQQVALLAAGLVGGGLALSILVQKFFLRAWSQVSVPRSPLLIGEYKLTLENNIVHQISGLSEITLPLSSIESVREDAARVYVCYDGLYALIINKRAFADEGEEKAFLDSLGAS